MNINDADAGDPDEVQFKPYSLELTERAHIALMAYMRQMNAAKAVSNDKEAAAWREEARSYGAEFTAELCRIYHETAEAEMNEDERIEKQLYDDWMESRLESVRRWQESNTI